MLIGLRFYHEIDCLLSCLEISVEFVNFFLAMGQVLMLLGCYQFRLFEFEC